MSLSDYTALIPPPNNLQPKYMAWVSANLQPMIDTMAALNTFNTAFNLLTAVGVQLDGVGQILGRPRLVNFQPSDGSSPILADSNYRLVLQSKVIQNQWDGTISQVYAFWTTFFPANPILVQDNQDMSMNVVIFGLSAGIQQDLAQNGYFLPKPAAVQIHYAFVASPPVFGFDTENALVQGYDQGYFFQYST